MASGTIGCRPAARCCASNARPGRDKNQVDVKVDFITSVGNKLLLTQAAEAQAGTGHDALHFSQWEIHHHADKLVPVDDVVQRLTAKYGKATALAEYLARPEGHWHAVPSSWGAQAKPPCARISVLKSAAGIDVTKMYPAKAGVHPRDGRVDLGHAS